MQSFGYEPLVSIIIPVYKGSNYVAEAIDSALAQTYKNIEIIVVNDGSPDDGETERAVLSYGEKVRYFYKENGGSSSALNMGIQNMRGEWFSWLSHDDLYYPEKLEKQIKYINGLNIPDTEISNHIFFGAADLIDGDGKIIRKNNLKASKIIDQKLKVIKGNEYLIAEPTKYNFHGCSGLIHRSAFEKVGTFDEKLRLINDVDMWYRLYTNGYKLHYIPEAIVMGRVHAKQISRSIGFSYHNPEQDWFWNRSLEWLKENHPQNAELYFLFGRNAYLKTRNIEGKKAFSIVKKLKPSLKADLFLKKLIYKVYAGLRTFAKRVYLILRA